MDKKKISIEERNEEKPFISALLFFTFRASGTVYTAIDVATGQEVRLLQLVSKTNISG